MFYKLKRVKDRFASDKVFIKIKWTWYVIIKWFIATFACIGEYIIFKTIDEMNLSSHIELNTSDSIKYLKSFPRKVDFLYLDSYDYNRNNPEKIKSSQNHHLEEIKAIEKKLHKNSIILIDDCKLPGGGKGKKAIKYLQSNGWKILMNKYQVLLTK